MSFHLSPKPIQFSFNPHLPKSSIPIKTSCGSYRTRTKAAINNLYGTTHSTESYYDSLGIPESGTLQEIKRAYKQLALKYHPDLSPPDMTEEYTRKFIRVQEAYETLSDPNTRAVYDRDTYKARRSGERGDWMNLWQSQIMELQRRSTVKKNYRGNNMSWGARIRRQRSENGFSV